MSALFDARRSKDRINSILQGGGQGVLRTALAESRAAQNMGMSEFFGISQNFERLISSLENGDISNAITASTELRTSGQIDGIGPLNDALNSLGRALSSRQYETAQQVTRQIEAMGVSEISLLSGQLSRHKGNDGRGNQDRIEEESPTDAETSFGQPVDEQAREKQRPGALDRFSNKVREDAVKEGVKTSVKSVARKAVSQVKKYIKDVLKKITAKVAKAVIQRAAVFLLSNPYGWATLGAILLIILGLGLFGYFIGMNDGRTGITPVEASDPIADQDLINKVLMLTGNEEVRSVLSTELLTRISEYCQPLLNSANQDVKDKAQQVLNDVSAYYSNSNETTGRTVITRTKELLVLLGDRGIPRFTGPTRVPVDPLIRLNTTLHGGSYSRREHVNFHGIYIYYDKGTCDAVDLKSNQGSAVYPAFGGRVIRSTSDGHNHRFVVIENGDYRAVYAHIDNAIPEGRDVTINDQIGTISSIGHVHFQLEYKGLCVRTTESDVLDHSNNPNTVWGSYMWTRVKRILNLQ